MLLKLSVRSAGNEFQIVRVAWQNAWLHYVLIVGYTCKWESSAGSAEDMHWTRRWNHQAQLEAVLRHYQEKCENGMHYAVIDLIKDIYCYSLL